jgi:hypothetical protein
VSEYFRAGADGNLAARGLTGEPGTELAEPFDISLPAVTTHLKVPERAGPNHAWPRGALAALSPHGKAAQGHRRPGRALSRFPGTKPRPAGRLSAGIANNGEETWQKEKKAPLPETPIGRSSSDVVAFRRRPRQNPATSAEKVAVSLRCIGSLSNVGLPPR